MGWLSNFLRAATLAVLTLFLFMPALATADDWVAERLRGRVFVLEQGQWISLSRGDVVSDSSPIRSTASGRATFSRDNETITISGDTLIQIVDLGSPGRNNTVVHQQFGTVSIEAEVQQVQHFAVETPFLAAVVKGTVFTVVSNEEGAEVRVDRGRVEVRDEARRQRTEVKPGQRAGVSRNAGLEIRGSGPHEPITAYDGQPIAELALRIQSGQQGPVSNRGLENATENAGNPSNNGQGNANGSGSGDGNNGQHGAGNNGNGNGNSGDNGQGSNNGNHGQGNNGNGNGNSGSNNGNHGQGNNGNGNGNSGSNNGNHGQGNNGNGNGNSGSNNGNQGNNSGGNGNSGGKGNGRN